jgi:hypothetical protein
MNSYDHSAQKSGTASEFEEGDVNLVAIWLRKDPVRWVAGAMAGLFAGMAALIFAGILASLNGLEFLFPMKIAALPFLGNSATSTGTHLGAIIIGLLTFELVAAFWGVIYAHFTGTNSMKALLAMGMVWGIFSWIFVSNLFIQSFTDVRALELDHWATIATCLIYGLVLSSVAFFDRALRKS